MLALLSCNGGVVTQGDGVATRLLVATLHGIRSFERAALADPWRPADVALPDFHVSTLLHDRQSGVTLAGCHYDGGLWRSTDAGRTWQPSNEGLQSRHIYTMELQRRPEGTALWLGTEPPMLYRSDDLGQSWQARPGMLKVANTDKWTFPPPPHIAHVKNIAFHPARPDSIFICIEQGALLRSDDAGETWSEVTGYASSEDFFYNDNHRVIFKPSDPEDFVMNSGEGLYRSTHGTWRHLCDRSARIGYPDAMFRDPYDERALIMAGPQHAPREWREQDKPMANPTVLRSPDEGETWIELASGLPRITGNIEAMGLHDFGGGFSLYAGTATGEVYHSDDRGEHWSLLAENLPPISKGGHYRWFLTDERRAEIEEELRKYKAVQA